MFEATKEVDPMAQTIAFLGLGAMGSRMARRLHDAGYDVVVYNRDRTRAEPLREAGLAVAETPRRAVQGRDVVIAMVRDDEASRAVWLDPDAGAVAGLKDRAVAIESSTLTPGWIGELATRVQATGAAFLDAPVVGSRPHAEAGKLVHLVGGADADLDRVRELLLHLADQVQHVGPVGAGTILKLAVNALFGIQVAALAEVLGVTRRAGIDDGRTLALLSKMPITSPALAGVGGLMASRSFSPMFPIDLVDKDLGYVERAAAELGTTLPTATAVRGVYQQAKARELGDDNIHGVMKLYD